MTRSVDMRTADCNVLEGGESGQVAYAFLTYVFLSAIAYTAVNLAISALLSLMINHQKSGRLCFWGSSAVFKSNFFH